MKSLKLFAAGMMFALAPMASSAALINFNATGNPNVSGFVQFDDSAFNAFQFVLNTAITDLSLTAFGASFALADVVTTDSTIINSSGLTPLIRNGAGLLANNGAQAIAFFPDGFTGTAPDGDASLAFSPTTTFGPFSIHAVKVGGNRRCPRARHHPARGPWLSRDRV